MYWSIWLVFWSLSISFDILDIITLLLLLDIVINIYYSHLLSSFSINVSFILGKISIMC